MNKIIKYRILRNIDYTINKVQKLSFKHKPCWITIKVFNNIADAIKYRKTLFARYGRYL